MSTEDSFVKANQQQPARANGGCPQIAGGTQHGGDGFLGISALQIKLADLFALHDDQSGG